MTLKDAEKELDVVKVVGLEDWSYRRIYDAVCR